VTEEASIFGQATIKGAGQHTYKIDIRDSGDPGTNDTYRLLWTPATTPGCTSSRRAKWRSARSSRAVRGRVRENCQAMDADAEVERVHRDRRTREAVKVAESDERSQTWYGLFGLRQFGYDFLDDAAGPGGKAVPDRIVQQPEQLAAIQLVALGVSS
jgi:hypothetical protein